MKEKRLRSACTAHSSLCPESLSGASFCIFLQTKTKLNKRKIEMVSWSLNAIDKIYSTLQSTGKGQTGWPAETYPAGYVLDAWRNFQMLCLSILSQEDVEDIYLFGIMVIGFLLIGTGSYWIYSKME